MAPILGLVAVLLAVAGIYVLVQRKPAIVLDQSGLWLCPCLAVPVPWSQVVGVQIEGQPKVGSILVVDITRGAGQTFEVDRLRCHATALADPPQIVRINMTIEGLTWWPGQLLAAIQSHVSNSGTP